MKELTDISVIIPVYNSSKYLNKCLDSLVDQKYNNYEVILINDGSTDNSLEICLQYANNYNNFQVFSKENGGVSSARNYGLNKANGKWIVFVDSDDFVKPNYLSELIKAAFTDSILVIMPNEDSQIPNFPCVSCSRGSIADNYIKNGLMRYSGPVSKLFNRKIIVENNINFPLGIHLAEDAIFILRYLVHVENLITVPICNYITCHNEGSLNTRYYNFNDEWKRYSLWKDSLRLLIISDKNPELNTSVLLWNEKSCMHSSFLRCIDSLVINNEKLSLLERVSLFNSIPDSEILQFIKSYHPNRVLFVLKRWCIKNKFILLYILLSKCQSFKTKIFKKFNSYNK